MERNYLQKYIKIISNSKGTFKQFQFLIYQKLIKNRYQNDQKFLHFKITSKRARQSCISFLSKLYQKIHSNNVDFSSREIRSKKVRQSDVDFSQKYVKMTWKFISILFSTYLHKIEEGTSKRRQFFTHLNYIEKVRQNDIEIYQYFLFHVST